MSLSHRLNRARNVLLAAARRCDISPDHRATFVKLADGVEEAIEKLDQQEIEMSAAADAIRYERSRAETAEAKVATLTTALEAANAAPKLDADDLAEIAKTQAEQNPPPAATPA